MTLRIIFTRSFGLVSCSGSCPLHDTTAQWLELPVRENHHWLLNYQRGFLSPNKQQDSRVPAGQILRARMVAGNMHDIPFYYLDHPDAAEYRPATSSTKMMESYAPSGHSCPIRPIPAER